MPPGLTTLNALLAAPIQRPLILKASYPWSNVYWKDGGLIAGVPGAYAAPAGGRTYNNGDAGTIPFVVPPAGQSTYLAGLRFGAGIVGGLMIVDRLVDWGGGDMTLATAQAVTTPALPRYTDGDDVELWLEMFVGSGSTAQTATVSYTNQAGVAGQIGTSLLSIQNTGNGALLPVTLAPGDTGVRSVQSVTMSASTGLAGNLGVVLLRRLIEVQGAVGPDRPFQERDWLGAGMVQIPDTAALVPVAAPGASGSNTLAAELDLVQG